MDIVYSDSLSESGTLLFFGPVGDGMLFLERSFAIPRAQFRPPFGASIAQSLLVIEPHELPTTIRATRNQLLFLSQDQDQDARGVASSFWLFLRLISIYF
jgi:hypothetical protein